MPKLIQVDDVGQFEFPDDATEAEISHALHTHLGEPPPTPPPSTRFAEADPYGAARALGRPSGMESGTDFTTALASDAVTKTKKLFEDIGSGQRAEFEARKQEPQQLADLSRAIPADVVASLASIGDKEGTPSFTGNIKAAMGGETLPVDEALRLAAQEQASRKEFPTAATAGQLSQGVFGMAPMMSVGLAPNLVQKLVGLGFTLDQLRKLPKTAQALGEEMGKNEDDRDPDKIAKLSAELGQEIGLPATIAAGPVSRALGAEPMISRPIPLTRTQRTTDAEAIRKDTGQPEAPGVRGQGGETDSGGNVQQAPPGTPNAPAPGQAGGKVPLEPPVELPKDSGVTYGGQIRDRWQFDVIDPADGLPTQFTVKSGSTLEQVLAAAEKKKSEFAAEPAPVEKATPTAADVLARPKGQTTPEEISKLSDEEGTKLFTSKDEKGAQQYSPQVDSTVWGASQAENDPAIIKDLEAKDKETHGQFMQALEEQMKNPTPENNRKVLSLQAKGQWYRGALEGVRRKGGNYDAAVKDGLIKPAVTEPTTKTATTPQPPPKWASATHADEESGRLYLNPIGPLIKSTVRDLQDLGRAVTPWVKDAVQNIMDVGKKAYEEGFTAKGKANDYRKAILNWSAKAQRSFGEAMAAQKEIRKKVPDRERREGITNWIQAGGDQQVLAQRAAATTDKRLKAGYEAAMNLTPEELQVANDVKAAFDALGVRGQRYGVLNSFLDNYVTQIWNSPSRKALGSSARTLKDKFRYAKARTFDSFFDGEQAGWTPKTKDISELLPVYLHEMNSVIAARQLVEEMSKGVASDGRPLLAPRGKGVPVTDKATGSQATLVMPKAIKGGTEDYRTIENQPALHDWRWAAKDEAGNNIFLKSDLAVHPEVYDKFKNALGKSAIKEWYSSKTTPLAEIPKAIVKLLDISNQEAKRAMLGMVSTFHQVQEGWHGIGHKVNPSVVPKIDLVNDAGQMDAAKHGLMLLPDRASQSQFMEGLSSTGRITGLLGKLPVTKYLAKASDWYSSKLFNEYIPGLKYKTYQAILDRNMKRFSGELQRGEVKPEDLKILSAEQTNAAFGHLNYADLGRNPTIQHIAQVFFLAPDFLEARARFTGQALKGLTGAKVGREQLVALGTLAMIQAVGAYTMAKATGGEWDEKHPFEFHKGNRKYTMRSVPEDLFNLIKDPRQFMYSRVSPLTKLTDELRTGVDWKEDPISAKDAMKEALQEPIPLPARGFLGIGNTSVGEWEQLLNSVGLRISKYDPDMEKGVNLKHRARLLAPKLGKIPIAQRYDYADKQLSDLDEVDKFTIIYKLQRDGAFSHPAPSEQR